MGFFILSFNIFKEMGGSQIKKTKTLKNFFSLGWEIFQGMGWWLTKIQTFLEEGTCIQMGGGGLKVVQQKSKVELCLGLTVSELKIC